AVAGDLIVHASCGAHAFHGADRQHVGVVSGSCDGAVSIVVERVVAAVIAACYNHDDSSLPCGFNRFAKWIEFVTLYHRTTKRKIDDANVVEALKLDRTVDGRDYLAVGAGAIFVEHTQVDDASRRRNALERLEVGSSGGTCSVTGDQSGNMRAVTIFIAGRPFPWNKILVVYDARQVEQAAVT